MQGKVDLFNIDVYADDQSLYVRFDAVSDVKGDISQILSLGQLDNVAKVYANRKLHHVDMKEDDAELCDKKIIQHLLHIQPSEPLGVNFLQNASSHTHHQGKPYSHISIVYKLSNIPHRMINWLAFLSMYIKEYGGLLPVHQQFGDHTIFKNLDTKTDTKILITGEDCKGKIIRAMMEKIVAFKSSHPELIHYQEALSDMETLRNYYVAERALPNAKTLIQCLSYQRRCPLFYGNQYNKLAHIEDAGQKDLELISLAENMLSKMYEFLFMMELINTQNKIKFIEPCLGTKAHDENYYQMHHTELMLIYFGEFHQFPDGQMGIINLDKNPAYLKFYAKGTENYDILHPEFHYLAKCLDVQLEPDCDFHEKNAILFTIDCSPKLANLNLHLNASYSKTLFNVRNTWAFWTRIKLALDNNLISLLPYEILDDIITKAQPSFQKIYNNKVDAGFFHAVQLGKERGRAEHEIVVQRSLAGECLNNLR